MMKKHLIKILSILGCVVVALSSFLMPVMAAGITDGLDTVSMYSYWNLRYLTVQFTDGDVAMYEFPNVFYGGRAQDQEVTLVSDNTSKTILFEVSTFVDVSGSNNEVAISFDTSDISSMRFHFIDSVIKPYPGMIPSLGDQTSVYLPYIIVEPARVVSLNSNYSEVRPVTTMSGYDFVFANSVGSWNGLIPVEYETGVYQLAVPQDDYDAAVQFYESQGYQSNDIWLYYDEIITTINLRNDDNYSPLFTVYLPLSNATSNVYADSNFVAQYYQKYYHGVPHVDPSDYNVDFTGWLATAVGGFLAFEFMPGVSFGILLLFVIGVMAFFYFLRLFAGG